MRSIGEIFGCMFTKIMKSYVNIAKMDNMMRLKQWSRKVNMGIPLKSTGKDLMIGVPFIMPVIKVMMILLNFFARAVQTSMLWPNIIEIVFILPLWGEIWKLWKYFLIIKLMLMHVIMTEILHFTLPLKMVTKK